MKLQIEANTIRFRISEAELVQLLAGERVLDTTNFPDARCAQRILQLWNTEIPDLRWEATEICLRLPRKAVTDYVATLPRRDALRFTDGTKPTLLIDFEVDVRDSVRTRMPKK